MIRVTILQAKGYSQNWIVLEPTIVFNWQIKRQSNYLPSFFRLKRMRVNDYQWVLANPLRFSSFIRQHLDGCLAAGFCTQVMDDIGCAVTCFEGDIPVLDTIFAAICGSGLKLVPDQCDIATKSMKFLGNVISAPGITPETEKKLKFSNNSTTSLSETRWASHRICLFFFRSFILKLYTKLVPFFLHFLEKRGSSSMRWNSCWCARNSKTRFAQCNEDYSKIR